MVSVRILVVGVLVLAIIALILSLISGYYVEKVLSDFLKPYQRISRDVEANVTCYSPSVLSVEVDRVVVPEASVVRIEVWKYYEGALIINKVRVGSELGSVDVSLDVKLPEGIPPLVVWGLGSAKLGNVTVWVRSNFDTGTTMWGEWGSVWVFIEKPANGTVRLGESYTITLYLSKVEGTLWGERPRLGAPKSIILEFKVEPGEVPECRFQH